MTRAQERLVAELRRPGAELWAPPPGGSSFILVLDGVAERRVRATTARPLFHVDLGWAWEGDGCSRRWRLPASDDELRYQLEVVETEIAELETEIEARRYRVEELERRAAGLRGQL